MAEHPNNPPDPRPSPPSDTAETGEVVVLLCTADGALHRAWTRTEPPPGFHLESLPELRPEHLTADSATLVLVDAAAALEAEGAMADAFEQSAGRCVWIGPAETLDRLGALRIEAAYDVLVTPTSPAILGRRLAGWARNIRRTAALEQIGRRVETLAEKNEHLAACLTETETQAARLKEQRGRLDQALRRIRQVATLSREINSLDLDKIIAVCVQRLPALIEASRASFYLYDAASDRLVLQGHSHGYPIAERIDLQESSRSPMAVAVRRGELLLIREFGQFEQTADLVFDREFRDQYSTHSCIIAPLKGGGRVRGVLNLADKQGGGRFDEEIDLPVVEQIAELIGASIYNVELYQEMERRAKTDPLTGLANRRSLEEALSRECDRGRRYGSRLTVLLIDVDQLKRINDQIGHHAGDLVLGHVATVLAETVRSVDSPGRWGGDEFLVVLPDTSASQAKRLARRLLDRFQKYPTMMGKTRLETTLSIGLAEAQPKELPESLIYRVDQAMYAAKRAGQNRITIAEPTSPDATTENKTTDS